MIQHAHRLVPLLVLAAPVWAGGGGDPEEPATARSSTTGDWLELDRWLARAVDEDAAGGADVPEHPVEGLSWGGIVRAFYTYSQDDIATGGGDDISGFSVNDADLYFNVAVGDFVGRVSADFAPDGPELEDGYGTWLVADWFTVTLGQFKPRVVRSGIVDPETLVFKERTFLGASFDFWDVGVQVAGHYDQFDWWLAVTNASTGQRSDHLFVGRGEWAYYDEAWGDVEGAHGAPINLRLLFGIFAYTFTDVPGDGGDGWGGDMALTMGPHSLHAEVMGIDNGIFLANNSLRDMPSLVLDGRGRPFSATYGYLFANRWQLAARYQNLDDDRDTKIFSGAVNWFPLEDGPVGWVLDVTHVDSKGPDGLVISVGVNVGLSRSPRLPGDVL